MPTILVVDDAEVDRRLAGGLLEMALGAKLLYAAHGKEALAQIEQHRPEIVITDLQMPEMDGLALVAAIKADYPLIPVVLMTAKGSEEIAAEALRLGAASYVPKKRLAEDLAPTVQRVLAGALEDRRHSQLMHHLDSDDAVFVLHNDLDLIKSLVAHIQQLLRCLPLRDETERMRVGIAVEEALKNAYYHGSLEAKTAVATADPRDYAKMVDPRRFESPYRDRRIHVRARVSRAEAVFVIRDEGPGFDASRLPDPAEPEHPDGPSGRGLKLMRSIMDAMTYNERGNEVTLVKRRAPETMEDLDAELEAE